MDKQFEVGKEYYCSIDKLIVKVEDISIEDNEICFSGYKEEHGYISSKKGFFWFDLSSQLNFLNEGKFTEL